MIVLDFTALASLFIEGPRSASARKTLASTGVWVSSPIWRPQILDALSEHIVDEGLTVESALQKMAAADFAVRTAHELVSDAEILNLSLDARISGSQPTYLLVARRLGAKLITGDPVVARRFPTEEIVINSFNSEQE